MPRKLDIAYPTLGLDLGGPLERQPPLTSPDALNARPYDPLTERQRGAQRPGVVLVDQSETTDRVDGLDIEKVVRRSFGGGFELFFDDFEWTSGTPSAVNDLGNATSEFVSDSFNPNYLIGAGVRGTLSGVNTTLHTWKQYETHLRPRSNASGVSDLFGAVVDYDATNDILVVGAPRMECEPGGDACGQVYVYERVGPNHVLKQRIGPPEEDDGPIGFGTAVAISGDWLAVGAPRAPGGGARMAGKVYLYLKQGGRWRLKQTLVSPIAANGGMYGAAIDMLGGILVVTEPKSRSATIIAGRGHVYLLGDQTWTYSQLLGGSGDNMWGNDLELHFDGSNTWLVVGEPGPYTLTPFAALDATFPGKVYIYQLSGTTFGAPTILDGVTHVAGTYKGNGSLFGFSVSMHHPRICVGAPLAFSGANVWGAANFFALVASVWTYEDQVTTGSTTQNGFNVAMVQDEAIVMEDSQWYLAGRSGAAWSITTRPILDDPAGDPPKRPFGKRAFFIKTDTIGAAVSDGRVDLKIRVDNDTTNGPKRVNIGSGVVVDDQTYSDDRVQQLFCVFQESVTGGVTLGPNYSISIGFRTHTTPGPAYVGLIASANPSTISSNNVDLATIAGVDIDAEGYVTPSISVSGFGVCAGLLREEGVRLTYYDYRLRLDVVGAEATLWLINTGTGEKQFLAYAPNMRVTNFGTATQRDDFGFVFGGAGVGLSQGLQWVDGFLVEKCTKVHTDRSTLVVYSAGRNIRVYERSLKRSLEPYAGQGAVRRGPVSLVGGVVDSTGRRRYVAILDGGAYQLLDLERLQVIPWQANPGKGALPVSTVDNFAAAKHGVVYRNAFVLFGLEGHEANWYMSRRADMFDWLYTPARPDGNQAVAGDVSDAGPLPEPITALAPHHGDYMVMASLRQQWVMRGHPNIGGVIDVLSSSSGILTHEAWTVDPDGRLYTMGLDGLYVMAPPISEPVRLSHGRLGRTLRELDPSASRVILEWSSAFDGLWAIIAPLEGEGECQVWWWDRRTGFSQQGAYGFWRDKYPEAVGPYSAATGVDPETGKGAIYFGGKGGVYVVDREAADDAGRPIVSYVVFTPLIADTQTRLQLSELRLKLAENADSVEYEVRAAESAESVLEQKPAYTFSTAESGKIRTETRRVQGGAISIKVGRNLSSNHREHTSGRWAVESVAGKAEPLGPIKRKGAL